MPLVLGYMRRYPFMPDHEVGQMQQHLAAIARENGYTLGTVHVEELPTDPLAFETLLAAIRDLRAPAVIVPTSAHLGRADDPGSRWRLLQHETEVRILVAGEPLVISARQCGGCCRCSEIRCEY
ncbi:hypothetical protein EV648_103700 [Kribbella sp. VKM Ac-2568]|nr:hypothetical protein EV648_103700 [Kribbella sp. VKM Ac-2568]